MSTINDVADALVAELNGHTFGQSFTASRKYLPSIVRREITGLSVVVVPAIQARAIKNHAATTKTVQIDIGIQCNVNPADNTAVDPHMDLLEEIENFLEFRPLATMASAKWTASEMIPGAEAGYNPAHINESMFTGIVRVSYRIC